MQRKADFKTGRIHQIQCNSTETEGKITSNTYDYKLIIYHPHNNFVLQKPETVLYMQV